jgi:hypothetical protein
MLCGASETPGDTVGRVVATLSGIHAMRLALRVCSLKHLVRGITACLFGIVVGGFLYLYR